MTNPKENKEGEEKGGSGWEIAPLPNKKIQKTDYNKKNFVEIQI